MDSQYDFVYNHFSYLYWIGLATLFVSFFVVAMKTENNSLRLAMAISTVFLIFSQAYFYYMIPGSDVNQFRGLTENFISTGKLSGSNPHQAYDQWPLFFILNKIITSITGLELRFIEFALYGVICSVITSLIYLQVARVKSNAYAAVIIFFIILIPLSIFEFWSAFAFSLCLVLSLLYLDKWSGKPEVLLATIVIFVSLTLVHVLVPLFFVSYLLVMFFLKKNRKYLILFVTTLTIYTLVLSQNVMFGDYIRLLGHLADPYLQDISSRIAGAASSIAPPPYIDVIAQSLSRIAVIATALMAGLGFIIVLKRKKLKKQDYALLLIGAMFTVGLLISPEAYRELSSRAFFLIGIPVSVGASYLIESKLRKYLKPILLVLLVLFSFNLMHQTFYDRQTFFQTKSEYQCANFMINSINWADPASVYSHYRVMQYLMPKSSGDVVRFGDDFSEKFPEDTMDYDYVVYTIGIAKSYLGANYSVDDSLSNFEVNHFNLLYNSGQFSCIFQNNRARK